MKTSLHVKLLSAALLSLWLTSGCAEHSAKSEAPASMANPEATAAIANASDAISMAKSNNWIWRDTESMLEEAKKAAAAGDNAKAITLADMAKFQAEAAIEQYNYESTHQRGLRR
jgi:hypothetical protein